MSSNRMFHAGIVTAALVLGGTGSVYASVISSTPTLPLLNVPYTSPSATGCIPAGGFCVSIASFTLNSASTLFNASGQDITSNVTFSVTMTDLANNVLGSLQLTGTFEQEVLGRTFSTQTGTWSTEILNLSASGGPTPGGATLTLTLDPAHSSTGTTTITPTVGGNFAIDSFFDVFFDLATDGPIIPLSTTLGPAEFTAAAPTPAATPLPAAFPMFATGLGALGLAGWHRKRRRAA